MLSEKMKELLNNQMASELYSSYLYLGLAYDFRTQGLPGFAHWFALQAQEEYRHALKIGDHILMRDAIVILQDLQAIVVKYECPCEAMIAALEHEQVISKQIHDIMDEAREEHDYGTELLMSWFVKEQIEEEDTLKGIISQLERLGDDQSGIIFMDKKLHERPA